MNPQPTSKARAEVIEDLCAFIRQFRLEGDVVFRFAVKASPPEILQLKTAIAELETLVAANSLFQ